MTRILVADDDAIFLRVCSKVLRSAGYEVLTAGDGNQALHVLRTEKIDLIIIDVLMPNKDGLETIKLVRERYAGASIISISGGGFLSSADYLRMSRTMGANASLNKPFSNEELLKTVEDVLKARPGTGQETKPAADGSNGQG